MRVLSKSGRPSIFTAGILAMWAFANAAEPANPKASPEARILLNYVNEQAGKKILSGQHGAQSQYEYVFQTTGKYAALWGTDLIFASRNDRLMNEVIGWWGKGVIPTVMWHWGAPTKGEGYEQSKMTIDVNKCFQTGSAENTAMMADLKRVADNLTILRDAKVPVIWRPVHECSGGWFWWDKSGGAAFKKLWVVMFDYFTKERGLDNLIWFLGFDGSPDAAYNPGGQYYDIIGADTYDGNTGSHKSMYTACRNVAGDNRSIAFHECGTPPDPAACQKDAAMWSWFMVWDSYIRNVDVTYLKTVYANENVLTLGQMPNWKQLVSSSVIRQPAHPRLILRNGKLRMAGSLETDPLRFYDA
ncbi:MAG: glycosyl hydrolase, partial [Fibrobacteria bacterium]